MSEAPHPRGGGARLQMQFDDNTLLPQLFGERDRHLERIERQLAKPQLGSATIVFHSIVLMYLSDSAREQMIVLLSQAGERATDEAPLAWLRMEAGGKEAEVHLTLWPGNRRTRIAISGFHGRHVQLMPEMPHAGEDHREP